MSFRRIPFQFSTTDPAERQRELEKRFGIPSRNKMYVDSANPISMGSGFGDSNVCSSPRLQHRVPIFTEGYDQPIRASVDSTSSVSENKKPKVRVIPIEVEGADTLPSSRHRTFSGPAGFAKECSEESLPCKDDTSPLKRSMQDLTKPSKMKTATGPKIYNIPIKVEVPDTVKKIPSKSPAKANNPMQKCHPKVNGCNETNHVKQFKSVSEHATKPKISEEQKLEININNSLKKIENVLDEFKFYESGVKEFNGTGKDKQYRYLDEMLTRCMLRLDGIDTMGNDKVRYARKNAVKQVQACIDLLEEKINAIMETGVPVAVIKDKGNIQEEGKELLENGEVSSDMTQEVSDVSDCIEKTENSKRIEGNDVVMADIMANLAPDNKKLLESTEVVIPESSPDDCLCALSRTRSSGKSDERKVNADMPSGVSELNDDEMVEITANLVLHKSRLVESTEMKPVSPEKYALPNLNEIKVEKLDDSKVNDVVTRENEMKEPSQDINSKGQLKVEMPESSEVPCSVNEDLVENPVASIMGTILQKSDVETKEIENTVNEIKEKAINLELQNIPTEETANTVLIGSDCIPAAGQSGCHTTSSKKEQNISETIHKN